MVEGKYRALSEHLVDLGADEWRATFAEIEAVLGFSLPESALKYPAWWANNRQGSRHSIAWLDAGWRTAELDLGTQHIVFRRVSVAEEEATGSPAQSQPKQVLPPERSDNILRCDVSMKWEPIGTVSLDEAGKLVFPDVRTIPAIYEFRLRYPTGLRFRYVGETTNLRQRFSGYRNAAEGQQTNVRLQGEFRKALAAGAEIDVSAVTESPWLEDGSGRRQVVLSSTSVRRLMENAAILTGGGTEIENLNQAN